MKKYAETGFPVAVIVMIVFSLSGAHIVAAPSEEPIDEHVDLPREFAPPSIPEESIATVDEETFQTAAAAVNAADPGDTVVLEGRFDERLSINTPNVTVIAGDQGAAIDGGVSGRVVSVHADNVTIEGLWIRSSGHDVEAEDAGVFVDGNSTVLRDLYLSDIAFGIWVDGVDNVTIVNNRIEGRADVYPLTDRGNGIHLWETANTVVKGNDITAVRDGIYYSWAEGVTSENNTIWDTRFGVHYMYSDDNRLVNNLAVDNDVGYALMISRGLEIVNNTAVRNTGTSGHGILLKDIEVSEIHDNVVVGNHHGLFVYNAQHNVLAENLVLHNEIGIYHTANSEGQEIVGNSFVRNGVQVLTTTTDLETWNRTDRGNYWSDARTADLTGDGTSEIRHRPAGLVELLAIEHPEVTVFAESPAFEAIRLVESSFPVVETAGVVDHHPLTNPTHDWREYASISKPNSELAPVQEGDPTDAHNHDDDHADADGHSDDSANDHDASGHANTHAPVDLPRTITGQTVLAGEIERRWSEGRTVEDRTYESNVDTKSTDHASTGDAIMRRY